MMISISIFGLKIEDDTNKTEAKKAVVDMESTHTEKKEEKKESTSTTLSDLKKETTKIEKKSTEEKSDHASLEDFIQPSADEAGRVFVIPGIDFAPSFSSKVDNLFIFGSDVEYLTEYMNNKLSVYANLGFGFTRDFFLLHLEAGTKYNLERMTRFMKPFIKLGLTLNPYFTSSVVYTPFAITGGLGFKFFINSKLALEQTNEFQVGGQLNDSTLYMSMRFRISAVLVF